MSEAVVSEAVAFAMHVKLGGLAGNSGLFEV